MQIKESIRYNADGRPGGIATDSLSFPEVRDTIPTLQHAVDNWLHGDDTIMETRYQRLPNAHIPIEYVRTLFSLAYRQPVALLRHAPTPSIQEHLQMLHQRYEELGRAGIGRMPRPVKTVSLLVSHAERKFRYLVTGVGDFQVDTRLKEQIADTVGLTRKPLKQRTKINDPEFDTVKHTGLISGVVGPFFEPRYWETIDGLCFVYPVEGVPMVSLAVSPIDTMVIPGNALEKAVAINFLMHNAAAEKFHVIQTVE